MSESSTPMDLVVDADDAEEKRLDAIGGQIQTSAAAPSFEELFFDRLPESLEVHILSVSPSL